MNKSLISMMLLMLTTTPLASAENIISLEETFDSIINAVTIPTDDNNGANVADWQAIENIKGVQWQWPRNQIAQHDYTIKGSIGAYADVEISGARTYFNYASISFGINDSQTEAVYIEHFNPHQLTRIPTSCDEDDSAMHKEAFYQWIKPGHQPLYIHYVFSFGTRMGNVDYNISHSLDTILNPYPNPCKVLQ